VLFLAAIKNRKVKNARGPGRVKNGAGISERKGGEKEETEDPPGSKKG